MKVFENFVVDWKLLSNVEEKSFLHFQRQLSNSLWVRWAILHFYDVKCPRDVAHQN